MSLGCRIEGHSPQKPVEWVYSAADIDHAKVVWAPKIGDAENAPPARVLSNRDRRVGLIEPDRQPVRLQPYPVPTGRPSLEGCFLMSSPGSNQPAAPQKNTCFDPYCRVRHKDSPLGCIRDERHL